MATENPDYVTLLATTKEGYYLVALMRADTWGDYQIYYCSRASYPKKKAQRIAELWAATYRVDIRE